MDNTRDYDRTITQVFVVGNKVYLRLQNINAEFVDQDFLVDKVYLNFTLEGFDDWVAGVYRKIKGQLKEQEEYRVWADSIEQETGLDILGGPYEL